MTDSDKAFESIHRANQFMRVMVVLAMSLMLVMLGFALIRINQVYHKENQLLELKQNEIQRAADTNRRLLEELKNSNHDIKFLICQIVTVRVEGRDVSPEIIKLCGPILAEGVRDGEGQQSFLTPGSDTAANNSFSQPVQAGSQNNTQNQQPTISEPSTQNPPNNTDNEPPTTEPGLVDPLQDAVNPHICTTQQVLLGQCNIRL